MMKNLNDLSDILKDKETYNQFISQIDFKKYEPDAWFFNKKTKNIELKGITLSKEKYDKIKLFISQQIFINEISKFLIDTINEIYVTIPIDTLSLESKDELINFSFKVKSILFSLEILRFGFQGYSNSEDTKCLTKLFKDHFKLKSDTDKLNLLKERLSDKNFKLFEQITIESIYWVSLQLIGQKLKILYDEIDDYNNNITNRWNILEFKKEQKNVEVVKPIASKKNEIKLYNSEIDDLIILDNDKIDILRFYNIALEKEILDKGIKYEDFTNGFHFKPPAQENKIRLLDKNLFTQADLIFFLDKIKEYLLNPDSVEKEKYKYIKSLKHWDKFLTDRFIFKNGNIKYISTIRVEKIVTQKNLITELFKSVSKKKVE